MPLRIAFDLDGVLADMDGELLRVATGLFAPATPPAHVRDLELSSRQQRQLWRAVADIANFWEGLVELEPGVVGRLGTLATDRGWEVIFLTKRPPTRGPTAQVQTQRWLEAKGFARPSVFVVQGSRGKIAAALALDVVVDDRPENCVDVIAESSARAVLVWRDGVRRPPRATKRLGIGVVASVGECLDALIELDTPEPERPGVMDRVLRMLGVKPAAL